jgi:hypothetical protein
MPITRTPIVDDSGSGKDGTAIDNAWKQELYDQIDALAAATAPILFRTAGGTKTGPADVYLDQVVIPAMPAGSTIRVAVVGFINPVPANFALENLAAGTIVSFVPLLPAGGTFAIDALIQSVTGTTAQGVAAGFNVAPGAVVGSAAALVTNWAAGGWPLGLRWTASAGAQVTWRWSIAILKPSAGALAAADEIAGIVR